MNENKHKTAVKRTIKKVIDIEDRQKKKKRSSIQTYYWKKKILTFKIIIQENFLEMKEDLTLHSQSPHLYLRKHLECSTPRLFLVKWLDVKGKEKNNPLEL